MITSSPRPSNPAGISQNPTQPESRYQAFRRLRRTAYLLFAISLSIGMGLAVVHLPTLLVVGLVGCGCLVLVIFAKPFVGLTLYTAIFFLRPGEIYPALQALPIERVVGVLTLVSVYAAQQREHGRFFVDGSRQTLLLLLVTLAVAMSVPLAYWRSGAVDGLVEFLKILIFYVLIVHIVDSKKRLRLLLFLYLGLIAYIAADSLDAYLHGTLRLAQGIERVQGQTSAGGDPNTLATTLVTALPMFLLLALHQPLGWRRLPLALGVLILLPTIAVTGSRAGILGFVGSLGVLWWGSRHRVLVGVAMVALLVGAFLVLPEQYQARYSTIGDNTLDASSQGRIMAWRTGLQMMVDHPLSGVGIGCFGSARAGNYSPEFQKIWLQPHNIYVQVPSEIGLIGATVFFLLLFEFVQLNRRTRILLETGGEDWQFERTVLQALFAGFIALFVAGMFGHSFLRRTWYIYGALGLSIFRIYANREVLESTIRHSLPNKN